jgi:septum formation protein
VATHRRTKGSDGSRAALVLASASPRRAELLRTLGLTFTVRVADVDESARPGEDPAAYVERVARAKAATIVAAEPDALVVAADTTVVLDGQILGKPADVDDARFVLRSLAGRTHDVLTAVVATADGRAAARTATTAVTFTTITDAQLDWYVGTGESFDKAGGYGIQGAGGLFVERIDGSYHNVVGLPLDVLDATIDDLDLGFGLLDWSG